MQLRPKNQEIPGRRDPLPVPGSEASRRLHGSASEVVYGPESYLTHPIRLMRLIGRDLVASRQLAWQLMVRDIRAQYRQSFLGFIWAFLPPIFMAVALSLAQDAQVLNTGRTDLPYPAYVIISMSLWQTFVEALNGPIRAVGGAKAMMARVNFPKESIVLAKLGEVFFDFSIRLILIFALFVWYRMPVTWMAVFSPLALMILVLFGTFLGVLLAPLATLYQDISRGLSLIVGLWFWVTPVAYSPPYEGLFATVVALNPVTPLLVTTRELATSGIVTYPWSFCAVTALTLTGTLLAWVSFRLAMPYVLERVGA